jgi:hypothetical protein
MFAVVIAQNSGSFGYLSQSIATLSVLGSMSQKGRIFDNASIAGCADPSQPGNQWQM